MASNYPAAIDGGHDVGEREEPLVVFLEQGQIWELNLEKGANETIPLPIFPVAGAAIPQIEIPPRVDLRAPCSELKAKDSHSNEAGEI